MHKPHWFFIDSAESFGGHEVMLLRWIAELRKQARITPVLIARADTRLIEMTPDGVLVMPLTSAAKGKSLHKNIQRRRSHLPRFVVQGMNAIVDIYRVARYVLRLRPELVVVAEGTVLAETWVTVLLRVLGTKTVIYVPLTQSGQEMRFGRGALRDWLVRNFYRHLPQAWITLSKEQAQQFASWSRIDRPIYVLPNTVTPDIEQAANQLMRANTGRSPIKSLPVPMRVLILGRLDAHQKNLDSLLRFLASHPELGLEFHFTFVGDGPFGSEIAQQLRGSPMLQELISLRPWSAALDVMRENNVLFLPSRYEGVPLVMLEAMALGVPVIATDLPGTRALLTTDCLFPTSDYPQAMHLLRTLKQKEWRAALIERNRQTFFDAASGAAFASAVDALTAKLTHLVRTTSHADLPADEVNIIRTP